MILTALSVVFTDCPPGPPERKTSILKSLSLIFISTSSASGKTATVAAEVCTLPWVSVSGTLCTLWTPTHILNMNDIASDTENIISLTTCFTFKYL